MRGRYSTRGKLEVQEGPDFAQTVKKAEAFVKTRPNLDLIICSERTGRPVLIVTSEGNRVPDAPRGAFTPLQNIGGRLVPRKGKGNA